MPLGERGGGKRREREGDWVIEALQSEGTESKSLTAQEGIGYEG